VKSFVDRMGRIFTGALQIGRGRTRLTAFTTSEDSVSLLVVKPVRAVPGYARENYNAPVPPSNQIPLAM